MMLSLESPPAINLNPETARLVKMCMRLVTFKQVYEVNIGGNWFMISWGKSNEQITM